LKRILDTKKIMAAEFQVVTQSFVNVLILTEKNEFGVEKRFAKDITIGSLKNKLELIIQKK
jgi:hypothetical protein